MRREEAIRFYGSHWHLVWQNLEWQAEERLGVIPAPGWRYDVIKDLDDPMVKRRVEYTADLLAKNWPEDCSMYPLFVSSRDLAVKLAQQLTQETARARDELTSEKSAETFQVAKSHRLSPNSYLSRLRSRIGW